MSDIQATLIVCAICIAGCALVKWRVAERIGEWLSGLNDKHLEKRKARWLADRASRYANLRQRQLEAWARDHEVK